MGLKKRYPDAVTIANEINTAVDNNVATESVKAEAIEVTEEKEETKDSSLAEILVPKKDELKSGSLTIRVKPSVKKKFESFCKKKGVSKASMFEYWVENIAK